MDAGQIEPFLKSLVPDPVGGIDRGQNSKELLVLVLGEELAELLEDTPKLVQGLLPQMALDLYDEDMVVRVRVGDTSMEWPLRRARTRGAIISIPKRWPRILSIRRKGPSPP